MLDVQAWQSELLEHVAVAEFRLQLGRLMNAELVKHGYTVTPASNSIVSAPVLTSDSASNQMYYDVQDTDSNHVWALIAALLIHCPADHPYGTASLTLSLKSPSGSLLARTPAIAAEAILAEHADVPDGLAWILAQLLEQLNRSTTLGPYCTGFAERLTEDMTP